MTAIPGSPPGFLPFYLEGASTPLKEPGPHGATLANGTTVYVEAGGDSALVQSIQLDWDAAIIMDVTVEDSNWAPGTSTGQATTSQVAGRAWCPEDPASAYVGVSGGTATGFVVAVAGGTAGTAIWHLGSWAGRRVRLKIVVGGTGGNANARSWGKF